MDKDENAYHFRVDGKPVEGYCIDVADKVKELYEKKFEKPLNFEFHLVSDNEFGSVKNATWNGMVGELISGVSIVIVTSYCHIVFGKVYIP